MTHSVLFSLLVCLSYSYFTSALSRPSGALIQPQTAPSSMPPLALPPLSNTSGEGVQWYFVSSDASQILPIDSATSKPANLNTLLGSPGTARNSYTFGFGEWNSSAIAHPALGKMLFECSFNLLDRIPTAPTANAVWSSAPGRNYICENGNAPGAIRMQQKRNDVDWNMAWHDLGFILKVLYDMQGTKDSVKFFQFTVNYTPDTEAKEYETVMFGNWT